MAWLGEGLTSLSSLKGQISSFTKNVSEVLTDGIVNEPNPPEARATDLEEANAKCSELQELLNSKEAEISILRRQNSELQKAVVEFRTKPNDTRNNGTQEDQDGFFWDPVPAAKSKAHGKILQDKLDQATVRIRDLEAQLDKIVTLNSSNAKDDAIFKEEGPSQKTELLRAKQDVMNRIIQMGEKSREVERNAKRLHQDELTLVNDFRTAISKLASAEQFDVIRSALVALEHENELLRGSAADKEKSDSGGFDAEGKCQPGEEREAELRRRIDELEAENLSLSASVDELDRQHAESIDRVLTIKEELQKKHISLQNAYEQLYVDYNQAQSKITSISEQQFAKPAVKQSSDSAVQTFVSPKADKQTEVTCSKEDKQTEITCCKEDKQTEVVVLKEDKETEIDKQQQQQLDVTVEMKRVNEILKNCPLQPSFDNEKTDSLFVNLAKQFVEERWKKETAERKLAEQSRDLKDTEELRDSLQVDCEDMQTNIESLLMQIQQLKSNLPSIPEASEERVASLETETESLKDEIRTIRHSNSELSSELKAIKAAIKEEGVNIDLARIEALLESKASSDDSRDPGQVLQSTLDENTALRRRIDVLESELRVSMERCKGLDENIELIEELKLDLENARRELKISSSNIKRLENSLANLHEAKNEVDADNELLVRDKEQLEADLKLLRESDLKKDDGQALAQLRDELNKAKQEKNDLEYDIVNMRKELDQALDELELSRSQSEKLLIDNERLAKENNKLLDQFSETQNESIDKIELLNTETSLLKQELDACKLELENALRHLSDMEEKRLNLENDNESLAQEVEQLGRYESENQKLKERLTEISMLERSNDSADKLDDALRKLTAMEERARSLENENGILRKELETTGNVNSENKKLLGDIENKRNMISTNEEEITRIMDKLRVAQERVSVLENEKQLLVDELSQLIDSLGENDKLREEIENIRGALELERKQREEEVVVHREMTVEYETVLDKLKSLGDENQKLKVDLDCLLAKKVEAESNASNLPLNESTSLEMQLYSEERSQLMSQLIENSGEIETLKKTIEKDKESALMARETVENLSQLISTKDNELINMNSSLDALKKERDELVVLIQKKHAESTQYHEEIQRLNVLVNEQATTMQKLVAEKDANLALLQEKETQLLWLQNESQVIKQRLQNIEESNNHGERCGIADHTLLSNQVSALEEKNKILENAILQDQSNIRYLQEQLTEAQSKEQVTLKEVERLRSHLMDIERNSTEEALQSEEIRRTLEARLLQAEERLKNSSTLITSANVRANQQVETLQQQLALIVQQRDDLQNKISASEDKVLSYSASLTNLQLVLEQFQRDKDKDIQAATEKLQNQLQEAYKRQDELKNEITNLKDQLAEAKECLRAASRLTEQLEKKSERIEQLNQEVNKLTELVNTADERIQEANRSHEGKVDRSLVKNLLLGYISSPSNDKISVLRVFANVLDFNETEREKSGLNSSSAKNSWFSSMVNSSPNSSKEQEASLSSAFIKFLENESQPKPQLPALPISNSSINRPGHSRQHSSSSTQSTLLLSNVTLPTFPDFVPARNTGSILKEVLKDS